MDYPSFKNGNEIKASRVKPMIAGLGFSLLAIFGILAYFAYQAEQNLPAPGEVRIEAENVGEPY